MKSEYFKKNYNAHNKIPLKECTHTACWFKHESAIFNGRCAPYARLKGRPPTHQAIQLVAAFAVGIIETIGFRNTIGATVDDPLL